MSENEMTNENEAGKEADVSKPKSTDSRKKAGIVRMDWHEELAKAKAEGRVEDQKRIGEVLKQIEQAHQKGMEKFEAGTAKEEGQALSLDEEGTNAISSENWARTDLRAPKKNEIIIDKILRFFRIR